MIQLFKRKLFNFINGIYSGIPFCCVLFYTKRNKPKSYTALEVDISRGYSRNAGYVLCDKCFKENNVVNIKLNGAIFKSLIHNRK